MASVCTHPGRLALLQDMQRPLYMRAADAIEYGVIDRLVPPQKASMMIDKVMLDDALCLVPAPQQPHTLSADSHLM